MTKGEYRVGINFNPSLDDHVGQIKKMAADMIDFIDNMPVPGLDAPEGHYGEVMRLKALAQTAFEDGAMWAVKAATKPAPESN